MARFHPPDPSAGDPNTVGGYHAVHARPAAFEGMDGASYSVEIVVDETGDLKRPFGGYLLFVRWGEQNMSTSGHLETPYLVYGPTFDSVHGAVSGIRLSQARAQLDKLIMKANERESQEKKQDRPWYEAMNDDDSGEDDNDS